MKKLKFLGAFIAAIAVISMMFISSCNKDTTSDLSPTINLKGGTIYTSADAIIDSGTMINVGITAFSNTSSSSKLAKLSLVITIDNTPRPSIDETLSASSADKDYAINVDWIGAARISITVTDKDGKTNVVAINITGKKPSSGTTLTSYPNKNMGGSTSSFGSYLDAETGNVYSVTQVNASTTTKNSIDVIFDLGTLKTTAAVITSTGTTFASTTLTSANFDAITTDATFGSYNPTLTQVVITAGQVVFFRTIGGKKGLIKVISMTSGTGDLNIDLKIQP